MAELEHAGVPLYAVNLAVGVSLTMPGVAADIAKGILGNLPFGAQSMAGVRRVYGSYFHACRCLPNLPA